MAAKKLGNQVSEREMNRRVVLLEKTKIRNYKISNRFRVTILELATRSAAVFSSILKKFFDFIFRNYKIQLEII